MGVVTDIDGNTYNTTVIGTKEWIVGGLRTTKYRDGTPIPNLQTDVDFLADNNGSKSGGYMIYNNDGQQNIYGLLYSWFVIANANGIAPTGFRVAVKTDIDELDTLYGAVNANNAIRETGIAHWENPNNNANNISGLTILPTGIRNCQFSGVWQNPTWQNRVGGGIMSPQAGFFWLDEFDSSYANYFQVAHSEAWGYDDYIGQSYETKEVGMAILCVRDYVPTIPHITFGASRIYAFYITIGSSLMEVFPLNFLESRLVDAPEGEEMFYRRKFAGSLTFTNHRGDFDLLYAIWEIDPYSEIIFTINRAGTLYWYGYFAPTDGKWDLDRCTFEVTPLPIDNYTPILENADIQYDILAVSPSVTTRALTGLIDITYTRNRWLIDTIEYLADQIKPGVVVSSEFFTDVTNYVTQTTNHLTLLTLAQKSDIKRPTSSDPAKQAMMSWNELMYILWGMFQVKWNYDLSIDTINIEHISWFTKTLGIDLRTQLLTKATNKYFYTKEKTPKFERFAFMEANNVNFIGFNIWYDSKGVNQDPKTNIKETSVPVTTDLEFIINSPDSISDNGFVMLCNYESGGNYYVRVESNDYHGGIPSDDVRLNMHLSWGNLHHRYFRHNRILIEGYLNSVLTTFWSSVKNIKQECFAKICPTDNYDPANEITTELGETYLLGAKASVEQSELRPSGEMKFSLLYGPKENTADPIFDDKWILIEETSCGEFHAILSEAADDNLNIVINYLIKDSTGSVICNNAAPITWTIPITSLTDDFTIPVSACDISDIPVDGCIWYFTNTFKIVGRPDWKVGFSKITCDCFGSGMTL